MEPLTIITDPTPSLRQPSRDLSVEEILNPDFQRYLDQLTAKMFEADGVGIASAQIGKNIKAIIVNMPNGPEAYMNAKILKKSEAMAESEEGCLSVPGKYGIVMRHKKVTVEAINRHGRRIEMELRNFPAIVFQHEIDHTNGILFIDKAKKVVKVTNGRHI